MAAALLAHGMTQLGAFRTATPSAWTVIAVSTVAGASLLAGIFTPAGALVAALASLAMALGWLPQTYLGALRDAFPVGYVAVVSAAIALVGPGAYSVDARLFGRREIVIPPSRRPSDA